MSDLLNIGKIRGWIADALQYSGGTHTVDDVIERIMSGHLQLWPAERGCAVTEIVVYPRKKVLHVFLAAGEMDQIIARCHPKIDVALLGVFDRIT